VYSVARFKLLKQFNLNKITYTNLTHIIHHPTYHLTHHPNNNLTLEKNLPIAYPGPFNRLLEASHIIIIDKLC